MALRSFDLETTTEALTRIPREGRALFACAICERLLVRYRLFAKDAGWGDPLLLRRVLDRLWDFAAGRGLEDREIAAMQKLVMEATPHSERFQVRTISGAINSGSALYQTLELCRKDDARLAAEIGQIADATVDMEIRLLTSLPDSDPELQELVLQHPAVQAELEKQAADIEVLHQRGKYDASFAVQFRGRAASLGFNKDCDERHV